MLIIEPTGLPVAERMFKSDMLPRQRILGQISDKT